MPFRFYCSRCGELLYEAGCELLHYQTRRNACKTARENAPCIEEFIAHKIGLRCPKCGKNPR